MPKKINKLTIREIIERDIYLETDLNSLMEKFKKHKAENPNHFDFYLDSNHEYDYGYERIRWDLAAYRLETDEEVQARIDKEKQLKENKKLEKLKKEEEEKALLARLKEKYEKQ